MSYAIVGLLVLLVDQLMKFWTMRNVDVNAIGRDLIPGVLRLTHIQNKGVAFGLFSDVSWLRWLLLVLLAVFAVFIIVGIATRFLRTGFARWTGLLLLVGLLGNGIERLLYGYAVDMLEPTLFGMNLPIFNLADVLIVVFGILFCISLLSGGIGRPDEDDYEDDEEEDYEEPIRRRSRRNEEEEPIRARRAELQRDIPAIYDVLRAGSEKAEAVAAATLARVKRAMRINYFDDEALIAAQAEKYAD